MINYSGVYEACRKVNNRCCQIPYGCYHGAAWLYDQCMRTFQHPAAVGVTFQVNINLVGKGYVTINRDGSFLMSTTEPGA